MKQERFENHGESFTRVSAENSKNKMNGIITDSHCVTLLFWEGTSFCGSMVKQCLSYKEAVEYAKRIATQRLAAADCVESQ